MADISSFHQDQTALRAELDQLKQEAWFLLVGQGMDWYERFDDMIQGMMGLSTSQDHPWRVAGLLAEIGVLHMCESYIPNNEDD